LKNGGSRREKERERQEGEFRERRNYLVEIVSGRGRPVEKRGGNWDENRKKRLALSGSSAIQPEPVRYRGDCLGDCPDVQGQRAARGREKDKKPRTCSSPEAEL